MYDHNKVSLCANCGLPIVPAPARYGARWTHRDDSAIRGGWQGVRCPRRLTGAKP